MKAKTKCDSHKHLQQIIGGAKKILNTKAMFTKKGSVCLKCLDTLRSLVEVANRHGGKL